MPSKRVSSRATTKAMATILPIDFLAFLGSARKITDGAFIDSATSLRNFRRHLGLEAKAILFQIYSLDKLPPKQLIARLHIRDVKISEHIRYRCQNLVHPCVPEV